MQIQAEPTTENDKFTSSQKILLLIIATIHFIHIVDFIILMPLGPQLMRIFQITPQQFGFLVSIYTLSAGLFGLLSAFVLDSFNRKTSLLATFIGLTIGTFFCGISPNYYFLLASRFFTGAFGGVVGATVLSIIGDSIPVEKRGRAMGVLMTAFSLASVFGIPMGLYLASLSSWQMPFLVLAALGIPISLAVIKIIPPLTLHMNKLKQKNQSLLNIKQILLSPNQRWSFFFTFLLMMGNFSVIPFIGSSMVANVGLSEKQLAYIYLSGGALTIFTSPLIGRLADRHGKQKIYTILVLLSFIPILLITNLKAAPLLYALSLTSIFFIFVSGRMVPAFAMITSTVPSHLRGSFMGLNSCIQQLSSSLASFLAGLIIIKNSQGGLDHFAWVGVISVAAGLLSIYVCRQLTFDTSKL